MRSRNVTFLILAIPLLVPGCTAPPPASPAPPASPMAPSTSNDVDLPCPEQPTPPKPTGPALSCPFPIEADRFQINQARVVLAFCVDANGYASASRVVEDPGYGFAEAALQCVAKVRFNPGLDASGNSAPSRFVLSVRYLR